MLKVKGLTKHYGRLSALKNLGVEFPSGCINVIIGQSGCGKTSLFHCISGLEPFEAGTITLDDETVCEAGGKCTPKSKEIGYVLQGFSLFSHLTVLQNLTIAPKLVLRESRPQTESRALDLLRRMHIEDKKDAYPNHLSGGQRQRVSIARAIMMNPKVLLLDEPTNALDPQLVLSLEKTLKELVASGLTLIVSTHHLEFAKRISDHTVFMHLGEVIEESPGSELLVNPVNPVIQEFIREEVNQGVS